MTLDITDFSEDALRSTQELSAINSEAVYPFKRLDRWSVGLRNSGNALIHGDNEDVLAALAVTHPASVKCAYLDPPYNNGESYRHYFDNMQHDDWLAAITRRLELIKRLLRPDGSVWISIDDSELHYLKVACDTVFGREKFVATLVWERRNTRENRKAFSRNHEYLLVYAKDPIGWSKSRNSLPLTDEVRARYRNPDNDPRGSWQSVSANVQDGHAVDGQFYAVKAPNGKLHLPPKGRCWAFSESRMRKEIAQKNVWFGANGNGAPRIKSFLRDRVTGLAPETLWRATDVGTTSEAKKELINLFHERTLFDTPKPERLLQRVLSIASNPGDLVLDPYLGSGTACAVAHKMDRRYIGIEIGAHIRSHCMHRIKQVVDGEQGGVSKQLNWCGGGGVDFYTTRRQKSRERT